MPETNARIKVCHDTAANFKTNNPTLLVGEWALETDTKKMKIGDGSTAYNALPYSTAEDSEEWRKPADWIDIRSGALPNSVYFLVGHSTDYTTYPKFRFKATVSSGTYDVFVDGIKQATTTSGEFTELNWQTLALTSGFGVTYPAALRTHIVRITPTTSTATISAITTTDSNNKYASGLLWAHFTLTNVIGLFCAFGNTDYNYHPIFETVTSVGNLLKVNSIHGAFAKSPVKNIPVLDLSTMGGGVSISYSFINSTGVKKVYLKNIAQTTGTANSMFQGANSLEEIIVEGSVNCGDRFFDTTSSLKKLPGGVNMANTPAVVNAFAQDCGATERAVLDFPSTSLTRLDIGGKTTHPLTFIKGITVSASAPFTGISPQLDVSYTGLSRAALVNLFKSMPYNVGYTVVGTPNIVGGVVSGFSENNYLQFWNANFPLTSMKTYEASVKFTTENTMSVNQGIIGSLNYGSSSFGLRCSSYNRITSVFRYKKSSDGTIANVEIQIPDFLAQANTTYYGKMSWNLLTGAYYIGVSTDNISFYEISGTLEDYDSPQERNWLLGIGKVQDDQYFRGSIDLNETYIKVDGVTFFNGAATRQLDPAATNVGGVTITNGVASGFSTSKYVSTASVPSISSQDTFGFNIRFKTGTNSPGSLLIAYQNSLSRFGYYGTFKPTIRLEKANNTYEQLTVDYAMAQNTWYLYKAVYDGTNLSASLYADDGTLLGSASVATELSIDTGSFMLGSVSSAAFDGSIDLNNTYIIVNGTKSFSGMVPMTKTCSVVGCPGTADLTADDKAIATGKGWELTVA